MTRPRRSRNHRPPFSPREAIRSIAEKGWLFAFSAIRAFPADFKVVPERSTALLLALGLAALAWWGHAKDV